MQGIVRGGKNEGDYNIGDVILVENIQMASPAKLTETIGSTSGYNYYSGAYKRLGDGALGDAPTWYAGCISGYIRVFEISIANQNMSLRLTKATVMSSNEVWDIKVDPVTDRMFACSGDGDVCELDKLLNKVLAVNDGAPVYNIALDIANGFVYTAQFSYTTNTIHLVKRRASDLGKIWDVDIFRMEAPDGMKVKNGFIYITRTAMGIRQYSPVDGSLSHSYTAANFGDFDFSDDGYIYTNSIDMGSNYIYKLDLNLDLVYKSAILSYDAHAYACKVTKSGIYISHNPFTIAKYRLTDGIKIYNFSLSKNAYAMDVIDDTYLFYAGYSTADSQGVGMYKISLSLKG